MRNILKNVLKHKRLFYRFKILLLLTIVIVLILEAGLIALSFRGIYSPMVTPKSLGTSDIEEYAAEIMDKCSFESDQVRRANCYDNEIPKLVSYVSMEDAFQVAKLIQAKDVGTYEYCHVLGHRLSAAEIQKDVNNWKEVITRCPYGVCSNGCQHGIVQELFRSDFLDYSQLGKLEQEFKEVCEPRGSWNPTPFEKGHCYHGLGHMLLYSNPKEIPRLLEICDEISIKDDGRNYSNLCYEGLFMQVFQPLEPEDFALVEDIVPKKDELEDYCANYDTQLKRRTCWIQGFPLYSGEIESAAGIIDFCNKAEFLDSESTDYCFRNMFHVKGQNYYFNIERMENLCKDFDDEKLKARCFADGASTIIQAEKDFIGRAVDLCNNSQKYGEKVSGACYDNLVLLSVYHYYPGSEPFVRLCSALPSPWSEQCLKKADSS